MQGIYIFLMKVLTEVIKWLPKLEWSDKIPVVNASNTALNIFAWVNVFVPTELIFILLTLTGAYYGFRVAIRLAYAVKNFIS